MLELNTVVWIYRRRSQLLQGGIIMMLQYEFSNIQEDWCSRGKEDAWLGRAKQPPDHDPQAASFYDLGYSEGKIQRSPTLNQ